MIVLIFGTSMEASGFEEGERGLLNGEFCHAFFHWPVLVLA